MSNAFVTLTYDDEHLPEGGTLVPKDMQDWLKRLRSVCSPEKIRFYGVGEYGDVSERPHYHLALFNYPACKYGRSRYDRFRKNCCIPCDLVRDTWSAGMVAVGGLTVHSMQYVAAYVTKKMTSKDDSRLKGRYPEFARMSLRPGIGVSAMHELASVMLSLNVLDTQSDVPSSLRHGSRLLPLGRTLRKRLRTFCGMDEKAPRAVIEAMEEELQPLYESAKGHEDVRHYFREAVIEACAQKVKQVEVRSKIFKQGKVL